MPVTSRKSIPPSQAVPPIDPVSYDYFGPASERPAFENVPTAPVSWANAWWLADFSMLAYSNDSDVAKVLPPPSTDAARFTVRPEHFFSVDNTQGFVASNADAIVVAFRGTELPHLSHGDWFSLPSTIIESGQDWFTNVQLPLTLFPDRNGALGSVHSGFYRAFVDVSEHLSAALNALLNQKRRAVWFTGHSLGGALATLAAAWYGQPAYLYTYGCPRVGDDTFVARFPANVKTARFNVAGDPVALLPLRTHWGLPIHNILRVDAYQVLGTAIWLDANSKPVMGNAPVNARAPNPFAHAPMLYSNLLWNNLLPD